MAQAVKADELLFSFGIDTHIDYTDGRYANVGEVLGALDYLGLDTVRDHAPNPASDAYGQNHLGEAADAGLQFVFSVQREVDPSVAVQRIRAFVEAHPGSVVGIEGPNEVNNWPVTYKGLSGQPAALAYQRDLFAAVNADPLLKDLPILSFTGYTVASASDYTTIHTYAKDGDQPFSWLARESGAQMSADPGKPLAITEIGYHTSLSADSNGGWEGVDEATQAKLLLNTMMDGAWLGSKQTFIYELLDAYADPQGSNQEKHFGLFNLDYTPKLAAIAIHNLTTILSDANVAEQSLTAGALDYAIHGLPSSGRSYLTVKSDGSFQIVLWNEPDIWNQNLDSSIQAAATNVAVDLGASFATVEIYDPLIGSGAIRTLTNVSSLSLDVVDHPVIINIKTSVSPSPARDHLYGGSGNDTFLVDSPTDIIDESRGAGTDTVNASVAFSLQDSAHAIGAIENLTLTGTADVSATGNALSNILFGNSGNNILDGREGADKMTGRGGDDSYVIDNAGDVASEQGGSGTDTIWSSISFSLAEKNHAVGSIENLILTGDVDLNGNGNSLNNKLSGNAGDNRLDGMKGNDWMIGGWGNDTYIVESSGDIVDETGGGGTDEVVSAITFDLSSANPQGGIEKLTLSGSSVINATGNELSNRLTGNSGINSLSGGQGDDELIGGNGNDILTGGGGADRFVFNVKPNATRNIDLIVDFSHASGDKIALDHDIFSALGSSVTAASLVNGTKALQSDDRLIFNPTNGALSYDADGSAKGVAVQIGTLSNVSSLLFDDFLIL
jgi:Ca2+-binding RTX toxin-like protein